MRTIVLTAVVAFSVIGLVRAVQWPDWAYYPVAVLLAIGVSLATRLSMLRRLRHAAGEDGDLVDAIRLVYVPTWLLWLSFLETPCLLAIPFPLVAALLR